MNIPEIFSGVHRFMGKTVKILLPKDTLKGQQHNCHFVISKLNFMFQDLFHSQDIK